MGKIIFGKVLLSDTDIPEPWIDRERLLDVLKDLISRSLPYPYRVHNEAGRLVLYTVSESGEGAETILQTLEEEYTKAFRLMHGFMCDMERHHFMHRAMKGE